VASIFKSIKFKKDLTKSILLVLALGLSVLVYLPGLSGGFVHDDFPNIVKNQKLQITSPNYRSIASASFSSDSGTLKRPVSMFTFAINYYYSGLNPFSYKLFNLVIHIFSGLSLFFLCRLLLDSYRKLSNTKLNDQSCFYISLFTSVAWLASPINLTGVLYVIQRMTSLAALFSILGLCFYVIARRSMIFENILKYHFFLLSGVFFVIAIFCKETGALNLFYLICIEICFFRFHSNAKISANTFRSIFLFITLAPIAAIVTWLLYDPSYITNGYDHRSFSLSERVLTESRVLIYYLKWIIAPNITELGLFHDDFLLSKSLLEPITTLVSAASLILLLITSIILIKYKPLVSFGILFFFSSHILESSIINLEIIYEHRNYLASFGIIFSVVSLAFYIVSNSTKKLALIIFSLWCCALFTTTALRAYQWKDSVSLAFHEASHHPKSPRANYNLGRVYADLAMRGLLDEKERAVTLFEKSMVLSPTEIAAESAAIIYSSRLGMEINPTWISSINNKLKVYPITHITTESFKEFNRCLSHGCNITVQQVFEFYNNAINNALPGPNSNRSALLTLYAEFSANQLNDYNIAYNAMMDALAISPEILQYRVNLAMLTIVMGKNDEASMHIAYLEKNNKHQKYTSEIESLKKDLERAID
jgi:tetratricopeptide (TPR) repeat protein